MAREMRREGFMAADIDPAILDDSFAGASKRIWPICPGTSFQDWNMERSLRARGGAKR